MDIEALRHLSDLKYEKSVSKLRGIIAQEAKMRAKIAQLQQQARDAHALPADTPHMQNIGADVIWLKWVAKTLRALHIELAQILAQKEAFVAQNAKALGRKSVTEHLAKASTQKRRQDRAAAQLETTITTHVVLERYKSNLNHLTRPEINDLNALSDV